MPQPSRCAGEPGAGNATHGSAASSRHAYPQAAILADYARAAAGFGLTAGPAILLPVAPPVGGLLLVLAGLFLVHGLLTRRRQRLRIRLEPDALHLMPAGASLRVDAISGLSLAYYSVRRDGRNGWMQARVRSRKRVLRLDSRMEGFEQVVAWAARAADRNGVVLGGATRSNLSALGIRDPGAAGGHA